MWRGVLLLVCSSVTSLRELAQQEDPFAPSVVLARATTNAEAPPFPWLATILSIGFLVGVILTIILALS